MRISLKKKNETEFYLTFKQNEEFTMKRFAAYIIYLIFFFFLSTSLSANIRLPAVIGSHMVLQQRSEVTIWGWCDVSEKINLRTTWDTTTYSTAGSTAAKWEIKINTPGSGGPYQITIEGNNKIILKYSRSELKRIS